MKNPKQDIMEYMMKTKKKKIITFIALYLICLSLFHLFFMPKAMPRKPFEHLSLLNVNSVEIVKANCGKKKDGVYLLQEDEKKVLSLIKDIRITGRADDSDENFSVNMEGHGYTEMFCIRTRDGKTIRVGVKSFRHYSEPQSPILYIDFIEYDLNPRSIEKCEELYSLYSSLAIKY